MRLDDGCQQNGWSGHPSNLSRSEDDNLGFRYQDLMDGVISCFNPLQTIP
jgi:hypothetical protein